MKMIYSDIINSVARSAGSLRRTMNFIGDGSIRCKLVLLMSLVLLSTGSANALVIYDNGVTTPTNFPTSDISTNSQTGGSQVIADDFTLLQDQDITDVHWTGRYFGANSPVPDSFTIEICTGLPNSAVCAPLTLGAVLRTVNGGGWFDYSVDVTPFFVDTTVHWVTIYNNTFTDNATDWLWGANQPGNAYQLQNSTDLTDPWSSTNLNMDFELTGVPEPGTLALFGLGLAGLRLSRRKIF